MVADQTVLLVAGTLLVLIGLSSMSTSRHLVKTVMAFQVIVFGVNLALFSSGLGGADRVLSDAFVLLSVIVGASVEAVGLAIIVAVHRKYGTLDPAEIRRLRG
jgi:multicomponent Na+:H+ antiporter subunit C